MAIQTINQLIDDLDGGPADQTVAFGFGGEDYTIELSDEHLDELRAALEPYLAKATRVKRAAGGRTPRAGGARQSENTAAIRTWAKENGYELGERGRIPIEIKDAYHSAHGGAA